MTNNLCSHWFHKKNIFILLLAATFFVVQTTAALAGPPPPRGGGPGHGPRPVHHGGPGPGHGHGHGGPSPAAVIGTAIGAIAIGAAVGAAVNSAAPAPAPAPAPVPAPVPAPAPVVVYQPTPASAVQAPPIPYGKVFSVLPAGYTALMASGQLYYYYAGTFYKLTSSGYLVVRPPAGAVIASLPPGYTTVQVGAISYFYYGGAYYRQLANGFEVVTDLTAVSSGQQLTNSGKIIVTSKKLNVRSGPSKQNSIVTTVFSGDILQVVGNAPGWYYVRISDDTSGWVMAQFTTPAQPADG